MQEYAHQYYNILTHLQVVFIQVERFQGGGQLDLGVNLHRGIIRINMCNILTTTFPSGYTCTRFYS
jgi:hypothetical protein